MYNNRVHNSNKFKMTTIQEQEPFEEGNESSVQLSDSDEDHDQNNAGEEKKENEEELTEESFATYVEDAKKELKK